MTFLSLFLIFFLISFLWLTVWGLWVVGSGRWATDGGGQRADGLRVVGSWLLAGCPKPVASTAEWFGFIALSCVFKRD